MKKSFFGLATWALFVLAACSSNHKIDNPKNATGDTDVPYTLAKNYFVLNNYNPKAHPNPKITSQADFDLMFGMARTMGSEGQPTPIDFNKQYVIAVVGEVTDKATELSVSSLIKNGNAITLTYNHTEGQKLTYSSQASLLLIVDNKHQGTVKLVRK